MQKLIDTVKKLHDKEYRKAGHSVFDHVLAVYNYLLDLDIDDRVMLQAALIHHSLPEHEAAVTKVCDAETIAFAKNYQQVRQLRINVKPYFDADRIVAAINTFEDTRLLVLRLVDKAVDSGSLFALLPEDRKKQAIKRIYYYAPLANLLGLSKVQRVLEENSFKTLYPEKYYEVEDFVAEKAGGLGLVLKDAISFIDSILYENSIPATVEGRIKTIPSLFKKAWSKTNNGPQDVADLLAIRVITDSVANCYAAESLLNNIWHASESLRNDYIQNPKPSGYRSLHLTYRMSEELMIEVQFKTAEMHEYNEHGAASHIIYKFGPSFKQVLLENSGFLKRLNFLENSENSNIKIPTKNIFAYTPKGDVVKLPAGSTVVDFAFSLHSDLGLACNGALVNNSIRPLKYELQTGDTVTILLKKSHNPVSRDWLQIAKTKRARSAIRKAIRKSSETQ
ncbi:bifunctional (p)ppGpp synthetase/guanosine-3',5'-bis(diphosphate) 3'-pyrophosphohydrolase [Candidatus Nomurabacteria bacterium]|nr:bifunctional (p)ppGpp synthetase/guanosine-3',5'-bis(diphosphate) 3'-pyrophosphohydrolase [Candidatus Nomurabacteria bacterium]MCB9827217.1 bifunctional (p)ppGpp synthetase/guanosine-3',5'-bis(diphosphate) 3'-pyrophosphohydrolase [Candidatus Nomurabacteria bacterium]MCB9827499.1 bifunctional (p)ppGpp synthetase/guanosine-3',5'-bis(diphosphate) 3'-pyrophosphohydrolase [Candidatus Nomurabacteria bacterium]HXK52644.1 TGS domain-containing protein [bacterium]